MKKIASLTAAILLIINQSFAQILIIGDPVTVNINDATLDYSGSGTSAIVFDSPTASTVNIANTSGNTTITGNVSASTIDLSTNGNNDVTLNLFDGASIIGGAGLNRADDSNQTGGNGGVAISSAGNAGLDLDVKIGSSVVGGIGGAGALDSASTGFNGGEGGDAIIYRNDGSTGTLTVNGTVTGGKGGAGGESVVDAQGGTGGTGGAAIHFDDGDSLVIGTGAVIAGGAGGNSGAGGDVFSGNGGTAIEIDGSGAVITMSNGSVTGGAGGASSNGTRIYAGNGATGLEFTGSSGANTLNMTGGVISGGAGGTSTDPELNDPANGGDGVIISGSSTKTINISGTGTAISGGDGTANISASDGGHGIRISGAASANITVGSGSQISGGDGADDAGSGIHMVSGSTGTLTVDNSGSITSGTSQDSISDIAAISLLDGTGHDITNSGTIKSFNGEYGIYLKDSSSNSILNQSGATIEATGIDSGSSAISLDTATLTSLTNNGTITSSLQDGGQAIELTGGGPASITTLINNGTISALEEHVILLDFDTTIATLTNSSTGVITSLLGTDNTDSARTILNGGTITTLNNSGTITSENRNVFDNSGTIVNFNNNSGGVIANLEDADGGETIHMDNDGSITTLINAGEIRNDSNGDNDQDYHGDVIFFKDDAGSITTLTNTGTIQAFAGADAIDSEDDAVGGVITLNNSGTITGNIDQNADLAYTLNQTGGTITGDIELDSRTGNDINISGGTITGSISQGTGSASSSFDMTGGDITGSITLSERSGESATFTLASGVTSNVATATSANFNGSAPILIKNGAGTLVFGGEIIDNSGGSNSAQLQINAGTMRMTKSAASVNGAIDLNAGTLDIQDNTITFNAASDLAAASNLQIDISSSANGKLKLADSVDASVVANDSLNITLNSLSGASEGVSYVVIDATGAGGGSNLTVDATQINIVESSARYNFTPSKVGDTLVLSINSGGSISSGNNSAVGDQIDLAFGNDDGMLDAINGISSSKELNKALETLSPDESGGSVLGSIQVQEGVTTAIESHLDTIYESQLSGISSGDKIQSSVQGIGVWNQFFGQLASQEDQGNLSGYKSTSGGVALGVDATLSDFIGDKTVLGISYAYGIGDVDVNNNQDSVDIQSHQVTIYSMVENDKMRYDLQLSYSRNLYQSQRNIQVGAISRIANADYSANQYGANARVGYQFGKKESWQAMPYIGTRYTLLDVSKYSETDAGTASLNVDEQSFSALYGVIGLDLSKEYSSKKGYVIVPEFRLKTSYDFQYNAVVTNASFSGGGSTFKTNGIRPQRHTVSIGTGFKIAKNQDFEVSFAYDVDLRNDYYAHNALLNLRYDF